MDRPRIVVMTPVKNEAWILPSFLASASMWADDIIIADQSSDDGSRELAQRFPKVTLIDHPSHTFSEVDRQRVLIAAARRLPGPRVLMALDADEIMTATIIDSPEWHAAIRMSPGTTLEFGKVELYDSTERYYMHSADDRAAWLPFGYIDDGLAHEGNIIHTCRVPQRLDGPRVRLDEVALLHLNRLYAARIPSKERWYRCFMRITYPQESILRIQRWHDWYERLHHGFDIRQSPPEWLSRYTQAGITFPHNQDGEDTVFWWDWDVLRMFEQHGVEPFRYLDIWSFDWEALRLRGVAQGKPGLPQTPIQAPHDVRARFVRALLQKSGRMPGRRSIDRVLNRLVPLIR